MSKIFISYRWDDSNGRAHRLRDHLERYFDVNSLFMDIENLEPGVDFVEVIERTVNGCDVLLAVIGKNWLSVTDGEQRRRLDNPDDLLRREVSIALQRNILVVPVLVDRADPPKGVDLPEDLKALARREAFELRDKSFREDVEDLANRLASKLNPSKGESDLPNFVKEEPVAPPTSEEHSGNETQPVSDSEPTTLDLHVSPEILESSVGFNAHSTEIYTIPPQTLRLKGLEFWNDEAGRFMSANNFEPRELAKIGPIRTGSSCGSGVFMLSGTGRGFFAVGHPDHVFHGDGIWRAILAFTQEATDRCSIELRFGFHRNRFGTVPWNWAQAAETNPPFELSARLSVGKVQCILIEVKSVRTEPVVVDAELTDLTIWRDIVQTFTRESPEFEPRCLWRKKTLYTAKPDNFKLVGIRTDGHPGIEFQFLPTQRNAQSLVRKSEEGKWRACLRLVVSNSPFTEWQCDFEFTKASGLRVLAQPSLREI